MMQKAVKFMGNLFHAVLKKQGLYTKSFFFCHHSVQMKKNQRLTSQDCDYH